MIFFLFLAPILSTALNVFSDVIRRDNAREPSLLRLEKKIEETFPNVEPEKMIGRWYQAYGNPMMMTFLGDVNMLCPSVDIFHGPEGSLHFLSSFESKDVDMPAVMMGTLNRADREKPHTWDVERIFSRNSKKKETDLDDYQVIFVHLGPENEEGRYDYCILSDKYKLTLFLLVRDLKRFEDRYMEKVSDFLAESGFDKNFNEPIPMSHSKCKYRPEPIKTVSNFKIEKHAGRYYEMFRNPFSEIFLRVDYQTRCSVVDYVLNEDKDALKIEIGNTNLKTGRLQKMEIGEIAIVHKNVPGQLYLKDEDILVRVVDVGPLNEKTGKYEYSIITDPMGLSLHVLALDPENFEKHREKVEKRLDEMKLREWWKQPIRLNHEKCKYPSISD